MNERARVLARPRPHLVPAFVQGLFHILCHRAFERGIPAVVPFAQLQKPAVEIVEERARDDLFLGHRLLSIFQYDHSVRVSLGLPLRIPGIGGGRRSQQNPPRDHTAGG